MKPSLPVVPSLNFLQDGGEMGELTRQFDWSHNPLGVPEQWPQSLRTTLGILLHSAFPMFLFWGKELTCFYNDAYRPSLGTDGKHPAIGKKGEDVWPDIWDFIYPLISQVMSTGKPVYFQDQFLPIFRNGKMEDVYWTFSYSPAYDDDGSINGVFVTCSETTRSVLTVKKLSESEKRFQNLIRDATVGIVVVSGADMIVTVANDAYAALISRNREELLDKPLFTILPETEPHFKPIIARVMETGEQQNLYDHPYFILTGDEKKEGYLDLVYQPYREEDGTVTGVMILCQEVTEKVRAVKKLEESEQQIRALVESAPFPIGVYTGREMRILLVNQSIMDVWGKGNDVTGKTYFEVLPELEGQQIYSQLDDVFMTGIPFHAKNQRVDLVVDGRLQVFYFNYSFTPLYDKSGNIYGVMNTAADVTDLNVAKQKVEESERNFRNIITQAPVAMCILLGPDHVVEIANEMMIELWGKPVEAVMNKPVFEGLPDARGQGLEELLAQVYQTGESFYANERPVVLFRKGKSETVYQNFVYEPYRNSDGIILGVLAITLDVTQQVLARQQIEEVVSERTKELAEANANLERSNAELAQFAYIASHDLQEPIRKVSTFIQMLEASLGKIDERSAGYFERIKVSSARMLALVKDVLAYSELSRSSQVFKEVDLQQVVEEIKNDLELVIQQKNAVVTQSGLPVIQAIPLQMQQLFGNLVSNALKFTRPGVRPEIHIHSSTLKGTDIPSTTTLDKEGYYHRIEVKDNGIGFSLDHAEQIFHIFQRLHGKKEYEGTGIGLSICQKIVQTHHGNISAFSVPGEGSSFVILLPQE